MRHATAKPTARQLELLNLLRSLGERDGEPPSIKGMARHLKVTPKTVRVMLRRLEAKGLIEDRPVMARLGRYTPTREGGRFMPH